MERVDQVAVLHVLLMLVAASLVMVCCPLHMLFAASAAYLVVVCCSVDVVLHVQAQWLLEGTSCGATWATWATWASKAHHRMGSMGHMGRRVVVHMLAVFAAQDCICHTCSDALMHGTKPYWTVTSAVPWHLICGL